VLSEKVIKPAYGILFRYCMFFCLDTKEPKNQDFNQKY